MEIIYNLAGAEAQHPEYLVTAGLMFTAGVLMYFSARRKLVEIFREMDKELEKERGKRLEDNL